MGFMENLSKNEKSYTENGAVGYKTSGHAIVDLNFKIPSYREVGIDTYLFDKSMKEDSNLTLKWLLYLRDIKEGVGERNSFREFTVYLCDNYPDIAEAFLDNAYIEDYGRWDDYIYLYANISSYELRNDIGRWIRIKFSEDLKALDRGDNVSLLAKWLPSENASSKDTKKLAKLVRTNILELSSKDYRKSLSKLRKKCASTEVLTSSNRWSEIDYSSVPSRANLKYKDAFLKHDFDRRVEFLNSLAEGETKINANALFLHDIVAKYTNNSSCYCVRDIKDYDATLEALWDAQSEVEGFTNTLVVRDGSGSMIFPVAGSNSITAMTVGDAITLYCAKNNVGEYHDKFITFSSNPKVVDVSMKDSLHDKLSILSKYDDCSNTDIYKVFRLVLDTAVKNNTPQRELPERILIVSDMEFDCCSHNDSTLFDTINDEFTSKGYKMPKLVFWNVSSRTNTIPLTENESGVILISGFSKNLMDMVMSSELDPYRALVKTLNNGRYACIDRI